MCCRVRSPHHPRISEEHIQHTHAHTHTNTHTDTNTHEHTLHAVYKHLPNQRRRFGSARAIPPTPFEEDEDNNDGNNGDEKAARITPLERTRVGWGVVMMTRDDEDNNYDDDDDDDDDADGGECVCVCMYVWAPQ